MAMHRLFQSVSAALALTGAALVFLPQLGYALFPIEPIADQNLAVRFLGVGIIALVLLAWSIKGFVEDA